MHKELLLAAVAEAVGAVGAGGALGDREGISGAMHQWVIGRVSRVSSRIATFCPVRALHNSLKMTTLATCLPQRQQKVFYHHSCVWSSNSVSMNLFCMTRL